jgi:hypothetical protein
MTNKGELDVDPLLKDWEHQPRWRAIPGYPDYEVNYAGDVRNKNTMKRVKCSPSFVVQLRKNGTTRSVQLDMVDIFPEVWGLRFE